jgi:hypothetical protein
MRPIHRSGVPRRLAGPLALFSACSMLGAAVAACDPPEPDTFRSDGGAGSDPVGLMQGTVLYVGPRPQCERAEDGTPTRIIGVVVLTLFEFDNPPPPAGSAASAISLLTIPSSEMFGIGDCMPEAPTSENLRPIMRSAPFTWPEISLGRDACLTGTDGVRVCPSQGYQVRGFYDYDGDFNPFFGVRNQPTRGDIGGGAFVSTAVSPPQLREIVFEHITRAQGGQVIDGVAVTLGSPVITERPIFEVDPSSRALDSSATIPTTTDRVMRENQIFAQTQLRLTAIVNSATPTPTQEWLDALAAADIDSSGYRFGVPQYGFYITNVDANADMMPDQHPILGPSAGIDWYTPIVILRRARTPVEQRLGIPDVLMIATIRPTVPLGIPLGIPKRTLLAFDVIVPAVGVMVTNPAYPATCRAPIIPPGNLKELYERIWGDCQEVPSGNWDVNVLSGIAGGTPVNERERCLTACTGAGGTPEACMTQCNFTVPAVTDNEWVINGGNFSSQAWTVPNELGCPDTAYRIGAVNQLDPRREDGSLPTCDFPEETAMMPLQGRIGGWSIVDRGDDPLLPAPDAGRDTMAGHGHPMCTTAVSGVTMAPAPVNFLRPPSEDCCPPRLDQFCGLPLCPLRDSTTTPEVAPDTTVGITAPYAYPEAVRGLVSDPAIHLTRELRVPGEDYVVNADGTYTPLCTPFMMPVACCEIAAAR